MDFLRWARTHWDRLAGVLAAVGGMILLLVAWEGASTTGYPAEQLPYLISGGLGGLFLLGTGATLWLSADLRDEWAELHGIREELRATRERDTAAEAGAVALDEADPEQRPPAPRLVAAAGHGEDR
jgi:hypothetical protein